MINNEKASSIKKHATLARHGKNSKKNSIDRANKVRIEKSMLDTLKSGGSGNNMSSGTNYLESPREYHDTMQSQKIMPPREATYDKGSSQLLKKQSQYKASATKQLMALDMLLDK